MKWTKKMVTKKAGAVITTLMLVVCLGTVALAEGETPAATADAVSSTTVQAGTGAEALQEAQAASDALTEALNAYQTARQASRKQKVLDSLKQELDEYVAAGSMTQEQADLILKYYAEQMVQNGANGTRKGGKGGRNGMNGQNGKNGKNGKTDRTAPQGNINGSQNGQTVPQGTVPGHGNGRHGRFAPQTAPASTESQTTEPQENETAGSGI